MLVSDFSKPLALKIFFLISFQNIIHNMMYIYIKLYILIFFKLLLVSDFSKPLRFFDLISYNAVYFQNIIHNALRKEN